MDLDTYIRKSKKPQAEWARQFGISDSFLSRLRSGDRNASGPLAFEIERLTGGAVKAEQLCHLVPRQKKQEGAAQ